MTTQPVTHEPHPLTPLTTTRDAPYTGRRMLGHTTSCGRFTLWRTNQRSYVIFLGNTLPKTFDQYLDRKLWIAPSLQEGLDWLHETFKNDPEPPTYKPGQQVAARHQASRDKVLKPAIVMSQDGPFITVRLMDDQHNTGAFETHFIYVEPYRD